MAQNIDLLNSTCAGRGATAGHKYDIDALNAICAALGITANHKYVIDAYNAIAVSQGKAVSRYNIDALNLITGGSYKYEDEALAALATNLNQIPWYLTGGINKADVVGAWKAVGCNSIEDSLINIVNPGTNNLVNTGITLDKLQGWKGFSDTQFLTGPVYKSNTYSAIILYQDGTTESYGRAFSAEPDNTGSYGSMMIPISSGGGIFRQGNQAVTITSKSSGCMGMNQTNVFRDAVSVGSITPSGTERNIPFRIGNITVSTASKIEYFRGYIKAVVVYSKSVTNDQIIAVSQAMMTEKFIVNEIRDFSKLMRYVNNPIIIYGSNAYNTYLADTPQFNLDCKIGDTYYGFAQAINASDIIDAIATYTSTDLVNWTAHSVNPAIVAESGKWDEHYLLHPSVIKVGTSEWRMYYSGKNAAGKYTIGYATSNDLVHWTKYSSNPVFSTAQNASIPWIIKLGTVFYLYYFNRYFDTNGVISYATSNDGNTFTDHGVALKRIVGEWDYTSANLDPYINIKPSGLLEMMYSTYLFQSPDTIQKIGYAVSWDGINWLKHNGAVLEKSTDWEDGYVGDSNLIDNPLTGRGNVFYVGVKAGSNPHGDCGLAIL
jgi:predicted GH43/DUF377 family glycosyl hydrolase